MIAAAAVLGYQGAVPALNEMGYLPTNESAWKILGAIVAPIVSFLLIAVVTGPFLLLLDIWKSVRNIEGRSDNENGNKAPRSEKRQPKI